MKLLLDEMYPATLAEGLQSAGIEATTVAALKLVGASDAEIFAIAVAYGYVVLTENVGDFTRIAADHSAAGGHHPGLLIALSSRFSRRPSGAEPLVAAISANAEQQLADRVVYLERPRDPWYEHRQYISWAPPVVRGLRPPIIPGKGGDMAEILLFHHSQGQTDGFLGFADELRAAGHTVHTPDLFDGRTFPTLEDGMAHVEEVGFDAMIDRGVAAVDGLPAELVYAGFSLGVLSAQKLAQTRPGAQGALLFYSCVPVSEFGTSWPDGVPVQIHGMDADPIFVGEGDIDAAREIVDSTDDAELFLYPGSDHYFADSSLSGYDAEATALLMRRVLEFLAER